MILAVGHLSSTPAKNHAKCDHWLESLHIVIFDILFKTLSTEINMWFLI